MATMNKCLSLTNKTHTRAEAMLPVFHRLGGASRTDTEHELARSRPLFFSLPARRYRGVSGYHLRMHPEVLQAETGAR
jgi:hypothetical protein